MKTANGRISWVDVLKGMGIHLIYLVHLPGMTGNFNLFFMLMAVPLFFFAGGMTASSGLEKPFGAFLLDKARRILWPYLLFGLLTMAVRLATMENATLGDVIGWSKQLLLGRRNSLFAASLWFLPCYFCLTVLYYLLRKLLRRQSVLLCAAAALSVVFRLCFDGPVLPWGLDYAGRYLFYYALGNALLPQLERLRHGGLPRWGKPVLAVAFAGAAGLNLLFYLYGRGYLPGLAGLTLGYVGQVAELALMTWAGVFCLVGLAMVLAPLPKLARLGQASLLLCCTESITKLIVPVAFEAVGLQLHYETPMQGLLCSALFLAVAYYGLAKPILAYFPWATGRSAKITQQTGKESVTI